MSDRLPFRTAEMVDCDIPISFASLGWLILFEPAGTLNTGNVVNERTHAALERV